jgi:hypothetical protein
MSIPINTNHSHHSTLSSLPIPATMEQLMRQEVVKRQITENDQKRNQISRVKPSDFDQFTNNSNFPEWKNIFILQMRVNDLEHTLNEDFEKLLDPERPDPCDVLFQNYPPLYQLELTLSDGHHS